MMIRELLQQKLAELMAEEGQYRRELIAFNQQHERELDQLANRISVFQGQADRLSIEAYRTRQQIQMYPGRAGDTLAAGSRAMHADIDARSSQAVAMKDQQKYDDLRRRKQELEEKIAHIQAGIPKFNELIASWKVIDSFQHQIGRIEYQLSGDKISIAIEDKGPPQEIPIAINQTVHLEKVPGKHPNTTYSLEITRTASDKVELKAIQQMALDLSGLFKMMAPHP